MLFQWMFFSATILSALAADRAWNAGYKLSACMAMLLFLVNGSLFVYSMLHGAQGIEFITSRPALELN